MGRTGQIRREDGGADGARIVLEGVFALGGVEDLRAALRDAGSRGPVERIDLSGVERMEGSAASVLVDSMCAIGDLPRFEGARPDVQSVLDLYSNDGQCALPLPRPPRVPFLQQVGRSTMEIVDTVRAMLTFVAEASGAAVAAVRRPRTIDWPGVVRQMERHGADGLPIVAVIGGLMGLITAYQAAVQLSKFGADTFVADLVSLSLTRELAPLMTAIVVAGRSGAAIAAEIGTMKVSEEIDALQTLGICPHRYLVFPRVLALVLVVPLLTLVADVVGIVAGAIVTTSTLEVGLNQFVGSVQSALSPSDIVGGLVKAAVFGALVGGLAAERGLAARGGAEGVGRATTSAVVATLFWLVFVDALFAVLFNLWGIF